MKKIYLVKKNPELPGNEDNWIMMNSYEFAMFMRTEEGQKRRNCFAQLNACTPDDDIYIVECGLENARLWRSEKDRQDYLAEQVIKYGKGNYVDLKCPIGSLEDAMTLEDTIADENINVESQILGKIQKEALKKAIETLNDEEQNLLMQLYLSNETISISDYGRRRGISQQKVSYQRDRVFRKLKKLLK